MKYETPEMTVLTPAINAIQDAPKHPNGTFDSATDEWTDADGAYADWE
jgi:hypothetical protein